MALEVAVVTQQSPTSTGTQNFFSTRLTANPIAAIFIAGYGESNGSFSTEAAHIGFGFTDGSRVYSQACVSDDRGSLGSTDTAAFGSIEKCFVLMDNFGNLDGYATFSSWGNDGGGPAAYGVTVSWDAINSSVDNKYCTAILIGDPDGDWDARAVAFDSHATQDSESTITQDAVDSTAIGFEPEALILVGHGQFVTPEPTSTGDDLRIAVGFALNDVGLTQGGMRIFEDDAQANGEPQTMHRDDYIPGQADRGWESIEITGFTASGFKVTTREASGSHGWAALCLTSAGTGQIGVRNDETPTSTGDKTYSFGFAPDLGIILGGYCQAFGTEETDSDAGSFGISTFDGDTSASHLITIEDAAATPNCASMYSSLELRIQEDSQTLANRYDATEDGTTSSPFDSDGFLLEFLNVEASARKLTMLALSADAPPATGRTVSLGGYYKSGGTDRTILIG